MFAVSTMLLYYTKNCSDNMELQMSSLLGRDRLWFDSCKRPPPVSDHSVLAFWVAAYGRFDCIQCFGSLLRGGVSSCACKHSSTSSKENVLKAFINVTFYRKQAAKRYIKGKQKRYFVRIWIRVRTCQNDHATPLQKWM